MTVARPATAERFWSKVAEAAADECWLWTGQTNGHGYGQFWDGRRTVPAHRWSYESLRVEIPWGLQIDHLCSVRGCVNPYHLEPVTWGVNSRRAVERGRKFGANVALHRDRRTSPPLQSQSPLYRRRADALAAEIDAGLRPVGTEIRYPCGGGSTSNPERTAVELLEQWGMVRRVPSSSGSDGYASAVVISGVPCR
jgi:hypothetical protein